MLLQYKTDATAILCWEYNPDLAEMVVRETLDGLQGGLQIRGRMITNLRCTDDIILLATSEAELQELVDRLDWVSRKYSLLINIDKTKVTKWATA